MKKWIFSIVMFFLLGNITWGQDNDYRSKVSSVDSIIETLYGVISGEANEKRNWELFKYLFAENAQLIPVRKNNEGKLAPAHMTPDSYIERAGKWLETNGFFEKEIYRVTESFGSITHIFSTYESYRTAKDKEPFARGINSIQLLNSGDRWWIINIYWEGESASNPIPSKYLPK